MWRVGPVVVELVGMVNEAAPVLLGPPHHVLPKTMYAQLGRGFEQVMLWCEACRSRGQPPLSSVSVDTAAPPPWSNGGAVCYAQGV